ncbi:MAG: c-type cytochrome [Dehalococcoidia bacterium]
MGKLLLAMTLLLWLAAVGCVRAEVQEGEALFRSHCSRCHGPTGYGTKAAPGLHPERRQEIVQQVRRPRGQMPAFSVEDLSNEELEKIAEFLMWLHYETGSHAH